MVYARRYFLELRAKPVVSISFILSVRKIGPTVLYITFYVVQLRRGFRAFQYNRLETADSLGVGHFATLW